jgi:hypothetical protein
MCIEQKPGIVSCHTWPKKDVIDESCSVPCCMQSGNPYGVSVFVDEYATWGTALKGRPLTETVNRKMTAYWP